MVSLLEGWKNSIQVQSLTSVLGNIMGKVLWSVYGEYSDIIGISEEEQTINSWINNLESKHIRERHKSFTN